MKASLRILLISLTCLVIAVGAYFWATGLMDSIYAYRSPLQFTPPEPDQPLGDPLTHRVVFVLIDALREDTALDPAVMPYLTELRQQGAWATMHSRPPSYSAPAYTVLFTGAWPELSDGPALNLEYDQLPTWTQDNLFSAAQRSGYQTAISAFNWFEKLVPQAAVSASFYTAGEDQFADRQVVDAALPWLADGGYELVLIHIDQIDYAGHYQGGPQNPAWAAAATRADDLLREISALLDLNQDTLLICSDHGQIDAGGHGGQDPVVLREPFVLVGAGVIPGQYADIQMVDLAPTLAALLGTNLPASAQGQVLTEMLALPPAQLTRVAAASQAQQNQLLAAYQTAIGQEVSLAEDQNGVTAYQNALEAARNARLKIERLPRFGLALLVLVLPLIYMWRKRNLELAWTWGAALLYTLVFNLRYALLDGRTYSLSSVYSADDLIQYTAIGAAIALGLAWLLLLGVRKILRRSPLNAAESVLSLTFITLYILALPVLWSYALNGVLVTWTLPEFSSMFLGFLSLIQGLIVAVLGLLLASISALIARFTVQT